ncbi:hypothetical protein KNE206_38450 [Kitasatospora sp. NE20-6]|uniref:hypothetical protein n=1 Tax=Kitasatospora sp. NE20-6 TaxID=2859066 RepID=UPI0034DC6A9A
MLGKNRDLSTLADTVEPVDRTSGGAAAARARAVVVAHARERDDCRLLLDMLGLREPTH